MSLNLSRNDGAARFAILCRNGQVERWQEKCIEELLERQFELVAVVSVVEPASETARRLYISLRKILIKSVALERVTIEGKVAGAKWIQFIPDTSDGIRNGSLRPDDAVYLKSMTLDFILALGLSPPRYPFASLARWGVWVFDFDARGGIVPHAFRSIQQGLNVTEAQLLSLSPDSSCDKVLFDAAFATDRRSWLGNCLQGLDEIVVWPSRAVDKCFESFGHQSKAEYSASESKPTKMQVALFVLKLVRNLLLHAWSRVAKHQQWNIGIVDSPISSFVASDQEPKINWFPLKGRRSFLADPFGVYWKGEQIILAEIFRYRVGHGSICRVLEEDDGFQVVSDPEIDIPSHASYPYLISNQGELYCVPETLQLQEIGLYHWDPESIAWTKVGVLIDGIKAVDTTVFQHNGRWWLFCTEQDRLPDARLMVFFAAQLEGPWSPHAKNPVKIDVRCTRPGGTPFLHEEQAYRPTQDCSHTYGGRIVVNQIEKLSPTEFSEVPVSAIEPSRSSPYPDGRHTLSAIGSRTLIDGHRFIFAWDAFLAFLRIVLRDLRHKLMRAKPVQFPPKEKH